MPALPEAIAALLADPADRVLARDIVGSVDPAAIAHRVEAFVRDSLGRRVVGCPLFVQSVGAVFGLDLDDGRRVVLKAHALGSGRMRGHTLDELVAVYAAHDGLAAAGLPVARVIAGPRPWPGGAAAILAWLPAGEPDDPHLPSSRRALAEALARSADALAPLSPPGLPESRLPADTLFPPAHNALFDLSAPGGEWIDARARRARAVLDAIPEPLVPVHTDVSAANVRVVGGRAVAMYDVDSVARTEELRCLASAAVHHTYLGDRPSPWPTREQAAAFVADYFAARPDRPPLSARERTRLDAAAIYAIAYTARCERSLDPPVDAMQDRLRSAPDAYFSE